MLRSDATGKVALRVRAGWDEAEIFVVDGAFHLVGKGVGALEVELPPGLYKVRSRTDTQVTEKFVVLDPNKGPQTVEFEKTAFSSAAPLADTRGVDVRQQQQASENSGRVHLQLGKGAQLFVFLREGKRRAPAVLGSGISLHGPEGELLCDFAEASSRGGDAGARWAACTSEVDPGVYRLRFAGSAHTLEQSIVVSPGWQTQVFLRAADNDDPSRSAIVMSKIGTPFDPLRPDLRSLELARAGLANKRRVLHRDLLEHLLFRKFDNPMLGLLGAHLLLLSAEPDLALLAEVVRNLRSMLHAPHPDVEALALRAGVEPERPHPFVAPPMLRNSWAIVVSKSIEQEALVPACSLAARIADRLWGEGPWLHWALPDDSRCTLPAERPSPEEPMRDALLSYARARRKGDGPVTASDVDQLEERWLVRALGVPVSVVRDARARLVAELAAAPPPPAPPIEVKASRPRRPAKGRAAGGKAKKSKHKAKA